jgi:hypothetical protein
MRSLGWVINVLFIGSCWAGQAIIPDTSIEPSALGTIGEMPDGSTGYVSCWAFEAGQDKLLWVSPNFSVWPEASPFTPVEVTRTPTGVLAQMRQPCCRFILGEVDPTRYLPVENWTCHKASWWDW